MAQLNWDPVDGATNYLVWGKPVLAGGALQYLGSTTATSVSVRFNVADFAAELDVRAQSDNGPSPFSALVIPVPPSLTVQLVEGVTLAVSWTADPRFGTVAQVGRGLDVNHVNTLASAAGGRYTDASGSPSTIYAYAVRMEAGPLVGYSNVMLTKTGPAAPTNVVSQPLNNQVGFSWTPVPDAQTYQAYYATGPDAGFSGNVVTQPSDLVSIPPGLRVTAAVRAIDASGRIGLAAAPVAGRPLPGQPAPVQVSEVEKVSYQWTFPAGADTPVIERGAAGTPFSEVFRTNTGTAFTDPTPPRWTPLTYRFRSIDSDAGLTSVTTDSLAYATEVPDQLNPGPGAALDGWYSPAVTLPGQSFTTQRSGQLMGVEVKTSGTGQLALTLRSGEATLARDVPALFRSSFPAWDPLQPEVILGEYFDLSDAGILVSRGETLRFDLEGNEILSSTGDVYDGGTLTGLGAFDPTRDLVFKTFMRAGAALSAPALISAQGGAGAAALAWQGTPGADHYDLLVAQDGGVPAALATTRDAAVTLAGFAQGATPSVVVHAVSLDGGTVDSPAVAVAIPAWVVDQANLASSFGFALLLNFSGNSYNPYNLTQSFTAGRSGQLVGIEVALSGTGPVTLELLTSTGALVPPALSLLGPFPLADAEPLSPTEAGPGYFDLQALKKHVAVGEQVQFRLSSPDARARASSGVNPGTKLIDVWSFTINDTLAFKAFVVPGP